MYVKFTRLDNQPIWINSAFVVTVEPARHGGSVVVPIGDGLDYDVRESPTRVLELLAGAASSADPVVVPVPAPKGLAPTPPPDVSPEKSEPEPAPPAHPARKTRAKAKPAEADAPSAPEAVPAEEAAAETTAVRKTAKRATKTKDKAKSKAKPKAKEEPLPGEETATSAVVEPAPAPAAEPPAPPALELSEDEVARICKMMPGSVRKLKNTLYTQFHILDVDSAIAALAARHILSVERDHVNWLG